MRRYTRSAEETIDCARRIGRLLRAGDTVALIGELGAGKTVFTKGIAEGLRVKDPRYVNSPTFVIVKEHKGTVPLYHIDVYRLNGTGSRDTIPYGEYFYGDGVTVVEWADKILPLLPREHIKVKVSFKTENTRQLTITGIGKRYRALIRKALV